MEKSLTDLLEKEKQKLNPDVSLTFVQPGEMEYVGSTDLNGDIEIGVDSEYKWIDSAETIRWAKIKSIHDPLECIASYLLRHEIVHSGINYHGVIIGCPLNRDNHRQLYDNMVPVLLRAGVHNESIAKYVLNTFEDLKVNLAIFANNGEINGGLLILKNIKKPISSGGGYQIYSPVDEVLIKNLLHCVGDQNDRDLFESHFSNSKSISQDVGKIVEGLALPTKEFILRDIRRLFNPSLWSNEMSVYAETIGRLAWDDANGRL